MTYYNKIKIRTIVREILGSMGVDTLVTDSQIDRIIYKFSRPEAQYSFEKITTNLWNLNLQWSHLYILNPQFTGQDGGIYVIHPSGSIEVPESVDFDITDVVDSPDFAFAVDGDWTTEFPADKGFSVNGAINDKGEYTNIDNDGDYVVQSSSYDNVADKTYIVPVSAGTSTTIEGVITFAPSFTDTTQTYNVTASVVDFAEVMYTVLFYIATNFSKEKVQSLGGGGIVGGRDAVQVLMQTARTWRGTWSV